MVSKVAGAESLFYNSLHYFTPTVDLFSKLSFEIPTTKTLDIVYLS